jgi:hypothetical protein
MESLRTEIPLLISGNMAESIKLHLSSEEQRQLSIGLLREWWITSTQALVDTTGSEAALKHLRPYFVHAGKAGGLVFQNLSGILPKDLVGTESGMGEAFSVMMEGKWGGLAFGKDGSFSIELRNCETKGHNKEVCISCCEYSICNAHMEINPDYVVELAETLSKGNLSCKWLNYKRGTTPPKIKDLVAKPDFKAPFVPDEELCNYLSHAWGGEFWILATKAFIDSVGSENALERLRFYMRHSGLSTGIMLSDRLKGHERKLESITDMVELIQTLHQRKGSCHGGNERADGTVDECPFASGAPPEICYQYEAFFNGICEAISPLYEFKYDRMMTKGDHTCHWVIAKKGTGLINAEQKTSSSDSSVELLKKRFATGEISEDEYRRMKKVLDE